jgi:hypothetical protein
MNAVLCKAVATLHFSGTVSKRRRCPWYDYSGPRHANIICRKLQQIIQCGTILCRKWLQNVGEKVFRLYYRENYIMRTSALFAKYY